MEYKLVIRFPISFLSSKYTQKGLCYKGTSYCILCIICFSSEDIFMNSDVEVRPTENCDSEIIELKIADVAAGLILPNGYLKQGFEYYAPDEYCIKS